MYTLIIIVSLVVLLTPTMRNWAAPVRYYHLSVSEEVVAGWAGTGVRDDD